MIIKIPTVTDGDGLRTECRRHLCWAVWMGEMETVFTDAFVLGLGKEVVNEIFLI